MIQNFKTNLYNSTTLGACTQKVAKHVIVDSLPHSDRLVIGRETITNEQIFFLYLGDIYVLPPWITVLSFLNEQT